MEAKKVIKSFSEKSVALYHSSKPYLKIIAEFFEKKILPFISLACKKFLLLMTPMAIKIYTRVPAEARGKLEGIFSRISIHYKKLGQLQKKCLKLGLTFLVVLTIISNFSSGNDSANEPTISQIRSQDYWLKQQCDERGYIPVGKEFCMKK